MKVKPASESGKVLVELKASDETLLNPLPLQLKRILVPVDFSDIGKKAMQYAVPFAAAFGAEVLLVHVLQPITIPSEIAYVTPDLADLQDLIKSAAEGLEELCAKEIGSRARFKTQVRQGVPWHEIVATAQEGDVDLIVLGTHGRTGLKHALLGSVTERVVRHAPCPVLVVRERERDFIPSPAKADSRD